MFDVVGIGDLCLDITAAVPKIPETDMASPLLSLTSQGGGKVPTAMVTLGRLGIKNTLFATYGGDAAGTFCRQELEDAGVDTGYMVCLEDQETNLTLCLAEQETGGRSFIGKYELRSILPEELDRDVISSAKFLHLWNITPATRQAAEWIHESGGKVVFDADRYNPLTKQNLSMTDVFICSEFFFQGMCGTQGGLREGLARIRKQGPPVAVVTLGAKGYAGMDEGGFFEGPSFENISVVDTTGAGDVFHGAFIYGLLQRWNARECARYASAVSAIKCTAMGGRTGIPDARTTEEFLKSGIIEPEIIERWRMYYKQNSILQGAGK